MYCSGEAILGGPAPRQALPAGTDLATIEGGATARDVRITRALPADCLRPTHECPGFEMGFGILLGVVYGGIDWQPK